MNSVARSDWHQSDQIEFAYVEIGIAIGIGPERVDERSRLPACQLREAIPRRRHPRRHDTQESDTRTPEQAEHAERPRPRPRPRPQPVPDEFGERMITEVIKLVGLVVV
ncbi:MAG: hypothetical protein SGJ11_12450 [Phycisphaerae bacterium]|nr:hypothetical protein [Phycisphaerae bacterium]